MNRPKDKEVWQVWQEAVRVEVRTRPWFAALLLQKGSGLFDRFVTFYGRLTAVTAQTHRRLAVGVGTAALLLALSSTPAHAATINVTPGTSGILNNGRCSLIEALINANDTNNGQPHLDCAAGDPAGADTIVLVGNTYSYNTTFSANFALPNITSAITIEANGATLRRVNTAPNMNLIRVSASGTLTLNNATITGGSTLLFSGAGISNLGSTTINNSTVTGNTANNRGGGIFNAGTLVLNNSTISGNTATARGGGIYDYSGTTTLNNSTISGNTATTSGGGIYNRTSATTLVRTIISGNTSPAGAEVARNTSLTGTITAANHNVLGHNLLTNAQAFVGFTPGATDITATSGGTNATALGNILNITLDDNGGSTFTHALVSGSPAIDIVPLDGLVCILDTSTDQRGAVRGSGLDRGDGACDAGAVEFGSDETPTAVASLTQQTNTPPSNTLPVLLTTLLATLTSAWLWARRRVR